MLLLSLLFGFIITVKSDDWIYHLNDSEYGRMPPMFHVDEYEGCLREDGGVYCTVKFHLVTDQPTPLYDLITRYSAHRWTHYNHSLPQYGICVTRTCKDWYLRNVTADLSELLEACLNESLWTEYGLKARVQQNVKCERFNDRIEWDTVDTVVALVVASLLMLNIVGSLRQIWNRDGDKQDNSLLGCFSIGRNWRKLTSPACDGPDPRLARLKALHGIRVLLITLLILAHTVIPVVKQLDNPRNMEEWYQSTEMSLMSNGLLTMQLFITLSGFLFSYQMMWYKETRKITWRSFLDSIIMRIRRLMPVYALVFTLIATLLRHFKSGPLWQLMLGYEIEHCRRDWWLHLLFINNYSRFYNDSQCMINSWYIALDTQLYIVGLMVFNLVRERQRIKFLTSLFITGMITVAAHTYYHDLDANTLFHPEGIRTYFVNDLTFKYVYTRVYTNLSSYTVGLVLGLFTYRCQKENYQFNRYLKHRYLSWMILPAIIYIVYINRWFYLDRSPTSVYVRALYAAFNKPILAVVFSFAIVSAVFQFESSLRKFFEADIWTVPARVSYSMAINNIILIKICAVMNNKLLHYSAFNFWSTAFSNLTLSLLAAIVLHIMVDLPFQNILKLRTKKKNTLVKEK